ncbi:SMODS domain-containing nucleotidyltransferase [Undibacterium sp. WLX3042]|uniref:SMODS domain-containing nucleotidyltransferase n=1 Tax=Undibacterium sp. WLX3042 TaxID=3412686 RepID=UPI003C2BE952
MSVSTMFQDFLSNIQIDNADDISYRYAEITASLNQKFRDTDSKTANSLQVGSYGRYTGIKGISDLDMLYIMPKSEWDTYNVAGGQTKLLNATRDAIKARYPKTDIRVDRLVVTVTYTNFHVEVQPVFEEFDANDQSYFKYPDTYNGGSWRITKPRQEIAAMKEFVDQKNKNLRKLCKMARAWKNEHGVGMGGLLIDTLAYNFLKSTDYYDDKSYTYYDRLSRDFFKYLMDQPNQDHYQALGSGQDVKVKKRFQKQAKKAYEACLAAIEADGTDAEYAKWKKVYGKPFPAKPAVATEKASTRSWNDTEEFIEDQHPIDVRYDVDLDCDVSQDGFMVRSLRHLLSINAPLLINKQLKFKATPKDIDGSYFIKWKILNRGAEAERRNCIRGQIILDDGKFQRIEKTDFRGDHIVECYVIKNNVVIARNRIEVPIE